jgi:two-component system, OmpR family, sensor histidine kinase KdpD
MATRRERAGAITDQPRAPIYDGGVTFRGPTAWRQTGTTAAIVVGALAVTTAAVFIVEEATDVPDASMLYLLAVALVAFLRGSWAAVASALGAFLAYNFLFVPPRYTFQVADAQHVLTLGILLAVGLGIARLTGLQRDQATRSRRREREARSLFAVSDAIARARSVGEAFPILVDRLASDGAMRRVWIGLGPTKAQEQVVGDSRPGDPTLAPAGHWLLRRDSSGDAAWVRLSPPTGPPGRQDGSALFRLALLDGTTEVGSLWAARDARLGQPDEEQTRLFAVAADQIGQAIVRDRLAGQATELEVARRSEELKAALLDSVSHDLRTPLSTIRAAAGTLADPALELSVDDRRAMAAEIDAEAQRLSRLVSELLDMSRIEGGALQPNVEAVPIDEVVGAALRRAHPNLSRRRVEVRIPDDLPPVLVDPVLADQVLDNLIDNVTRHTNPEALMRITATRAGDHDLLLRVEDAGSGVPADALPHLFEKFYRVAGRRDPSRRGTGMGLALVRGMVEAMGGSAQARSSELGGLAVEIRLPTAPAR